VLEICHNFTVLSIEDESKYCKAFEKGVTWVIFVMTAES
jgi:hypothetical protein